jgi:lysophospholipase L1-like esterase
MRLRISLNYNTPPGEGNLAIAASPPAMKVAFLSGFLVFFQLLAITALWGQSPPAIRIMPLGDSITNGVSSTGGYRKPLYTLLTNAGYNVDFVGTQTSNGHSSFDSDHQGHSGWRIAQLTAGIEGWFGAIADPDIILLHIGTNDFGGNDNTPTAIDRLDTLIIKIATLRPHANIIVTNLMERATTNPEPPATDSIDQKILSEFNPFLQTRIAAHVSAGRKVTFLDMRAAVPLSDMPDKLHPNQTGYDKMAAAWFEAIQAIASPNGDHTPPKIARVRGSSDGKSIDITFSKPVDATTATNLANYSINNGIVFTGGELPTTAALSSDQRTVTITLNHNSINPPPFVYGTTYTLTVNHIADRLDPANTILPNTTATFFRAIARGYLANVPESTGYTLVHSLNLPNNPNYASIAHPAYHVDNRAYINEFSRVAYYLELQRLDGDIQYAWVSMDAFTTDIRKIGVPTFATGAIFEQNVTNLNVVSNVPGVLNATATAGNIEFWPNNYGAAANSGLGGSGTSHDFDDTRNTTGAYGSMQVHNTADKKTVFSINNFGNANTTLDIGIGNNPEPAQGTGVDWTFANNGNNYVIKTLHVLVQSADDRTAPTLISATATPGRNRIYVKFSEPIASPSLDPFQFTLDHGVSVIGVTLAENQVDAILSTTTQPLNTPLTLTVSNVRDSSPNANLIAPNSTVPVSSPALPPEIVANVGAPAQNYELVYSLDLPTAGNLRTRGNNAYHWDDSANTSPFTRVAYYLELQKFDQPSEFIWVSMDAFTGDRRKIGVPTPESGAIFQQILSNLEIVSNKSGITTGSGIATGNIEFWPNDYVVANAISIPNASPVVFDFGDQRQSGGAYGSMQIHNHGGPTPQTLFAINHWGADGITLDIGIGNNPSTSSGAGLDWTHIANAGQYVKKTLHVLVLPGAVPPPPEPVATNIPEAQGYQLVYSLDIPSTGNLNTPAYSVNNSANVGPFKRIAYYLQLQTGSATPQYVWVSMDAFTTDASKIGVPNAASGAIFQQIVNNMNVVTNTSDITSGTKITTGNIEFWSTDYSAPNALNIPNSTNTTLFDWGDTRGTNGSHGSMQIHNHGSPNPHTLFAISNFGSTTAGNKMSIGIGSRPTTNPDWTFANNSDTYSSRLLQVYILPGEPDQTGPSPLKAIGSTTLNRLVLTMNEPVADTTVVVGNFSIPGLNVTGATLAADKKDIILHTSPQTPGTTYTVTVNQLRDRSPNGNLSPANASTTFTAHVPPPLLATIPAALGYDLIYQVELPAVRPRWNHNDIPYSVDESKYGNRAFNRVAYLMELDGEFVFVAFDAFTNQLSKIGIPTTKVTSTPFQQKVGGLIISSNKPGIITNAPLEGTPLPIFFPQGNIEFWHGNYSQANALGIPNADPDGPTTNIFDWGDTMSTPNGHGSFQVHNHTDGQVLFAFNNWANNTGNYTDLGLGNQPSGNPDWTQSNTGNNYTSRNLYVLAANVALGNNPPSTETPPTILTQPTSRTADPAANTTFFVNATSTQPLYYQWFHNGEPIPGANQAWLVLNNLHPSQAGTYSVSIWDDTLAGMTSTSATLTITNRSPLFSGYRALTTQNTPLQIPGSRISANASDLDLDPVSLNSVATASNAGGNVAFALLNGEWTVTYTPPGGYLGNDSFPATISDGRGGSVQGPVNITIVPALPVPGTDSIISSRQDGKIDAVFRGQPGQSYQIQRSIDLSPGGWSIIGTVSAGDDGFIPLHDPAPPENRAFYRVVPE